MTWWVAGAAVVGSIGGAMINSNAAGNAASGAAGAADRANALSQGQYDQTRADSEPWRNAGGSAINQLAFLMGLNTSGAQPVRNSATFDSDAYFKANPDVAQNWDQGAYNHYLQFGQREGREGFWTSDGATATLDPQSTAGGGQMGGFGSLSRGFSMSDFQADPGYAFRLSEGQKALERSASARGMSLSGAQARALASYGQNMGAQEYQAAYGRFNNDQTNLFNRLSGIAGSGQQSNQYNAALGAQNASYQGQNTMGAATTAANAGLYSAGQWGNALNQGTNLWSDWVNQQQQQANRIG